jgi:hypothetical protein
MEACDALRRIDGLSVARSGVRLPIIEQYLGYADRPMSRSTTRSRLFPCATREQRTEVAMKTAALVILTICAAVANLIISGFTQDYAIGSVEATIHIQQPYSALGERVVPFAADHTEIQLVFAGLPLLVAMLAVWWRWELPVATTLIFSIEMLLAGWVCLVRSLGAMHG